MFLLIDNYDSFTYNLVQAFCRLGHRPRVVKNDDPGLVAMANDPSLRMVCISPGPGHPSQAGYCLDFLKQLSPRIPVLGVCLGHQILGLYAGADVVPGPVVMHGRTSEIVHDGKGLYRGMPNPMVVGRYHSLVVRVDDEHPNELLSVSARGPQGEVMSMRFKDRPWVGVQYHPESILTPDGPASSEKLPGQPAALGSRRAHHQFHSGIRLSRGRDMTDEECDVAFGLHARRHHDPRSGRSPAHGPAHEGRKARRTGRGHPHHAGALREGDGHSAKCIDIVGTGGDGKRSFNCSTATSLTLAGMGYRMLKHGNRAVSSTSGAADALEGLGLPLEKDPEAIVEMLKERNFAFQFAPYFHPAFANVGPVRKQLGMRTMFNMLGPMLNPACPDYLMMGVGDPNQVDLIAARCRSVPSTMVAVFNGAGGYDELTTMGKTRVILITDRKMDEMMFDPALYGFEPCEPEDVEVKNKKKPRRC